MIEYLAWLALTFVALAVVVGALTLGILGAGAVDRATERQGGQAPTPGGAQLAALPAVPRVTDQHPRTR